MGKPKRKPKKKKSAKGNSKGRNRTPAKKATRPNEITPLPTLNEEVTFITELSSQFLLFGSASPRLRDSVLSRITRALVGLRALKKGAMEASRESVANNTLGHQCILHSIEQLILMWKGLSPRPVEAWRHAVNAEVYAAIAARAFRMPGAQHEASVFASRLAERAVKLRETIFPPQSYVSPGFTYTDSKCSICRMSAAECDHIEGMIYSGRICYELEKNVEGNHVAAAVETPADFRCIVHVIPYDEGGRDSMTGDWIPDCRSNEGFHTSATILSMRPLEDTV